MADMPTDTPTPVTAPDVPDTPEPLPTCPADALEAVRAGIVDLETLADAARVYLDALPRGADDRERRAVESVTRLVDRIARDAHALAALADETFAAVIADAAE